MAISKMRLKLSPNSVASNVFRSIGCRYYANIILVSHESSPLLTPARRTGFLRRPSWWETRGRDEVMCTCTCIHVSHVCYGIRAPAPHQVFGLTLRDVICEVYGHGGVEGHAVKGISVEPGYESIADQRNPAARLHQGISVSIPIPDPLNRMDWLATRRIDSPSEPEDPPRSVAAFV